MFIQENISFTNTFFSILFVYYTLFTLIFVCVERESKGGNDVEDELGPRPANHPASKQVI